nr:serine dehydratase beta chain [Microbacterium sp. CH12i]
MTAYVSAFDLFSIGVGPSSSHTVGPMRAALDFARRLSATGVLAEVQRVTCTLYGSLGATGIGHGTPDAVVAGLRGLAPESCDPADVRTAWGEFPVGGTLLLDAVTRFRSRRKTSSSRRAPGCLGIRMP